ncbi:MAG: TonB-dependent receptor [Bacteroidota bacterium]
MTRAPLLVRATSTPVLLAAWLLCILFAQGPAAQPATGQIEGRVTDAETGTPVPGVNLVVEGTPLGTSSGIDGRFALDAVPAGEQTLAVSALGYERATRSVAVRAGETARLALALRPDLAALGEVVVTGQKVQRSLVDTYASVGVLSPQEIEAFGVNDLAEAIALVGNVNLVEADNRKSISLRGINSDGLTQPSGDIRSVQVVIDGVTQTSIATRRGLRGLWDLAQVEVLRGPQSATYGRNAVAGAVVIETARPTYGWAARARLITDAEEGREGAFAVGGPLITDRLAFRVSGQLATDEFGIEFTTPGNETLDDAEYRNLRGRLLVEPDVLEGLTILVSASTSFDQPGSAQVSGPDFFARVADLPPSLEFRETRLESYGANATLDLGSGLQVESITARAVGDTEIFTPDSSNFMRDELRAEESLTQEVRATYAPTGGPLAERLSGTAGVFYGRFDNDRDSDVAIGVLPFQQIESAGRTVSRDAFASGRFRVIGGLTAIAGLRYTRTTLDDFVVDLLRDDTTDVETTFEAWLPELGLAYGLDDFFGTTQRLAFTAARGFRAGFAATEPSTSEVYEVDPEYLWNVDLAYRSRWLGGRLAVNANAFYYRYTDQQIAVEDTLLAGGLPLTVTRNAGSSFAYGFELEPRVFVGEGLSVYGSGGWLRTELDDFVAAEGDFSGNEFPRAPRFTGALGVAYEHPTGLRASARVTHTGGYFSNPSAGTEGLRNDTLSTVDERTLLGLRLGYESPPVQGARFTLTLFADNALDTDYLTSRNADAFASVGRERRLGIELSARF